MKKLFLLLMIALPLITVSQIRYGVKAGTTLSWYKSSTDEGIIPEYRTLGGFQGGAFVEVPFTDYLLLQPELLFSMRGAKSKIEETYTIPQSSGYAQIRVKLEDISTPLYIDLPVYLKVGFPSVGTDKFTIGAGPMFSYGVGGKMKVKGSIDQENVTGEKKLFSEDQFNLKDGDGNSIDDIPVPALKRLDISIAGFAAYEFSSRVALKLNYQYGLKDISDDPEESLWNRCTTISLEYFF